MSHVKIDMSTPTKKLEFILATNKEIKEERDLLKTKVNTIKEILKDNSQFDDQVLYLIKTVLK